MSSEVQKTSIAPPEGDAPHFSGKTVFGSIPSFEEVPEDKQLKTEPFLKACTGFSHILEKQGTAFAFPMKDMQNNIKKIEDRFNTNPDKYKFLNSILEEDAKGQKKISHTCVGILWLKRTLEFLHAFMLNLLQEYRSDVTKEDMRPTLVAAYEKTLKAYHGRMTQFLFSNITRLLPKRTKFLNDLTTQDGVGMDVIFKDISVYMENFSQTVFTLDEWLNTFGINPQDRV